MLPAIKRIAWRIGFVGRFMERTTYPFGECWKQAALAQVIYTNWEQVHPTIAADARIAVIIPKERMRNK